MHLAALVGWHGLKRYCPAALRDALRHAAGEVGDGVVAALLVAFHIHEHVGAAAEPAAHDEAGDELQRAQGFAARAYEQAGVVALDLKDGAAALFAVRLFEIHFGRHFHLVQQRVQHAIGHFDDFGRFLDFFVVFIGGVKFFVIIVELVAVVEVAEIGRRKVG